MGNMSYCRFENTYPDLLDCRDAMSDTDLGESEAKYRDWMIGLCIEIAAEYGDEDDH